MLLKKIVIAEDDDAISHLVNMALGDAGFLCLRAKDGEEAVNIVRLHAPDLLILDVMMPRVDGLEVARRIKADVIASKTPILMLTALGSVEHKVAGLDAGADDYLAKPFDLRELNARVRALIRAARRERERSPTTGLPGSGAIEDHIDGVLSAGKQAAVVHVDVVGWDAYTDQIGYARAEALVKSLGELVLEQARRHGPTPFVGHLGGVDFIAVVEPAAAEPLAQSLIAAFDDRLARSGSADNPLKLAVAVVDTGSLSAKGGDELARRMGAALRQAKQGERSTYVVWQPDAA